MEFHPTARISLKLKLKVDVGKESNNIILLRLVDTPPTTVATTPIHGVFEVTNRRPI